jgi:hypothetical protein
LADAEGITDGEDNVADAEFIAVSQSDGGQIFGLDFNDGDIGLGIGADNFGGEFTFIAERNFQLIGAFDDVVISKNITVIGDDDA